MAFSSLVWICQSSPSGRGACRDREIEFLSPSLSTQLIGRDLEIAPTYHAVVYKCCKYFAVFPIRTKQQF